MDSTLLNKEEMMLSNLESKFSNESLIEKESVEIDNLPIHFHAEIGSKKLTIKEINQLCSGSIVKFDGVTENTMKLFANGKLIGTGLLVKIEDDLAVQVNEINALN